MSSKVIHRSSAHYGIINLMRPIPKKHRDIIQMDRYFSICARRSAECNGRMTIEHPWIYGSRQISELWAYLPLCWHHHLGDGLNKEINEWLSLQRATDEDLAKYPRKNWQQRKNYLNGKYGKHKL